MATTTAQLGAISSVNTLIAKVFKQPKGDLADRLNSRITVVILALSSVLMMSSQLMGDPIKCWTPAQFPKHWHDFVDQYCYVQGTYFVDLEEELAYDDKERQKIPINYYQWVPYILALQAIMFYMPRFIWKTLIAMSGYDLSGAIQYVAEFWAVIKAKDETFKSRISAFEGRPSVYIWDGIRLARKKGSKDMALYYTISTSIQTLNALLQFYFLNSLLQSPLYTFWGPSLVSDLINGNDWKKTGHFPRITHCDFKRRQIASVQLDTVLCVLSLNIYYEKLFIFLWFWFLIVAIVSTSNSVYWVLSLCISKNARRLVTNYLSTSPLPCSKASAQQFFDTLGKDGLFILQQMSLNLGDIPASYLTIAMMNTGKDYGKLEEEDEDKRPLKSVKSV